MGHGACGSRLIPGNLDKQAPVVFRVERRNRRGEQRPRWNSKKVSGGSIMVSPHQAHWCRRDLTDKCRALWDKPTSQAGKASFHNYYLQVPLIKATKRPVITAVARL